MDTRMKTDIWISYLVTVLGLAAVTSAIGAIILTMMRQPVSEVLFALGSVALAGWARLLISPLNQRL
jgi:hypothetical protein